MTIYSRRLGKRAIRREREFARWWGNWFKGQRAASLQPRDVERTRVALVNGLRYGKTEAGKCRDETGPTRSNATINRYTDWLRHVCNWAIKQKRLRENAVLALQRKPEDEPLMFHYSLQQESKLMEQLNGEEVDMLRLAILTCLRQANHFALRKDQINLDIGVLSIPVTKNRKPRIVHLSEEAKDILRRQMARHVGSPWLFPGRKCSGRHLNARWWYKARQAGVRASWYSRQRGAETVACSASHVWEPFSRSAVQRKVHHGSGRLDKQQGCPTVPAPPR